MVFMNSFCSLVNLKVSWGTRNLKVCMYEAMIIMGGMIATTRMKIAIRGIVTMMKALDSILNLTFQNSMEGWILMNFWIGLIWWSMSLSIMIPLNVKK